MRIAWRSGEPYVRSRVERGRRVVCLSWGQGCESSAIVANWCVNPGSRDFDLEDLIVVTACLGDEHADTRAAVEQHLFPLLRAHGVRVVQVARAGRSLRDGVTVLDDTRTPDVLFAEGAYTLREELLAAGTVPQFGGDHVCALKHKAATIDAFLDYEIGAEPYTHAWGYNRDEASRIARSEERNAEHNAAVLVGLEAAREVDEPLEELFDEGYGSPAEGCGERLPHEMAFGFNRDEESRIARARAYDLGPRKGLYPLAKENWNWSRADCVDFLYELFGIRWERSACLFCPFNRLDAEAVARLRREPEHVARALLVEYVSLCLNPRSTLYRGKTLRSVLEKDGNRAALEAFERVLAREAWGWYRVRRVYTRKGAADRATERLATGTRAEMESLFRSGTRGLVLREEHGIVRAYRHERADGVYPAFEELFVVCPARPETKTRSGFEKFEAKWALFDPNAAPAEGAWVQMGLGF